MPFFYDLSLEDQEALAMHVVLVNTVLSESWYSYKRNSTTLILPNGVRPIMIRKFLKPDAQQSPE
jgi:hypothetical protein